jgi:CPA2 family monovalent cation:H+ antiporter-2
LGVALGLLPDQGRDLILVGAILSILINPLLFAGLDRLGPWLARRDGVAAAAAPPPVLPVSELKRHVVLVGFGRAGSLVAEAVRRQGIEMLVIDERLDLIEQARAAAWKRSMETPRRRT